MTAPNLPDPMCGWCNRPRLRDIDPATTVFLCKRHQALADRLHADIAKMLVPRDQLALPAGYDAWPTGIITTTPPVEDKPFDLASLLEWMRLWQQDGKYDTGLEAQICMEIQCAIVPISPIELAIRIAAIARRYFHNRIISSEHTGWRVVWLSERGGIVLTEECVRPHEAEQLGAAKVGQYNIAAYEVQRREHESYPDGSHFTGPWITVTSNLEPTSEEKPCSATNPD